LNAPFAATCIKINTAKELLNEVLDHSEKADALVMAAAVSDFTVSNTSDEKIKRKEGKLSLKLVSTEDILKQVALARKKSHKPEVVIGFAAETRDLIKNAEQKLAEKDLDLIVANNISGQDTGFEVDKNQVTLLLKGGKKIELPVLSKEEVAIKVVDQLVKCLKYDRE
jgi:phosphopantothenoylcysteine decarboxylase/phosphopantothenate--cysteine ligase